MKGNDRLLMELDHMKDIGKKAKIGATLCHGYLLNIFLKKKIMAIEDTKKENISLYQIGNAY